MGTKLIIIIIIALSIIGYNAYKILGIKRLVILFAFLTFIFIAWRLSTYMKKDFENRQ